MARRRRDIQPRVQLRSLTRASGGSPRRKLAWGPSSGAASASPISSRVSARLGGGYPRRLVVVDRHCIDGHPGSLRGLTHVHITPVFTATDASW
jgi:hypothetical protein